jgi:hypothetical protein
MAHKIVVDIVDPGDGKIKVTHTFWGGTETEARTNYTHHLAACEYFQSATEEGNVIEESFEIPDEEVPEAIDADDDEEEEEICAECGEPLEDCTC